MNQVNYMYNAMIQTGAVSPSNVDNSSETNKFRPTDSLHTRTHWFTKTHSLRMVSSLLAVHALCQRFWLLWRLCYCCSVYCWYRGDVMTWKLLFSFSLHCEFRAHSDMHQQAHAQTYTFTREFTSVYVYLPCLTFTEDFCLWSQALKSRSCNQ